MVGLLCSFDFEAEFFLLFHSFYWWSSQNLGWSL